VVLISLVLHFIFIRAPHNQALFSIEIVNPEIKPPTKSTSFGYNVFLPEFVTIHPRRLLTVQLGFKLRLTQPTTGILQVGATMMPADGLIDCGILVHPCDILPNSSVPITVKIQNCTFDKIYTIPSGFVIGHLIMKPYLLTPNFQIEFK
jgi:hypothetical protein